MSPQAVNKLAEIMNRKDMKLDQKKRGSTTDLRKKEKENRKLQLELNQEKEKFNHMAIKNQKELNEMQAASSCLIVFTGAKLTPLSVESDDSLNQFQQDCSSEGLPHENVLSFTAAHSRKPHRHDNQHDNDVVCICSNGLRSARIAMSCRCNWTAKKVTLSNSARS